MPMQYTENVLFVKMKNFTGIFFYIFLIFAQKIDCGYTLDLCFGAKIRKIGIPPHTPVLLYINMGFKGVYITRTCFSDDM